MRAVCRQSAGRGQCRLTASGRGHSPEGQSEASGPGGGTGDPASEALSARLPVLSALLCPLPPSVPWAAVCAAFITWLPRLRSCRAAGSAAGSHNLGRFAEGDTEGQRC